MREERSRDKYGREWNLPANERCPECGQPDSCGDCNHERLTDEEVGMLTNSPMMPPGV